MSVGLIAFLIMLSILLGAYAIFAPENTSVTEKYDLKGDKVEEKPTGLFEQWVRPAIRNILPQTPAALTEYANKSGKIQTLLVRSGNPWKLSPEEFVALRILSAFTFAAACGLLVVFRIMDFNILIAIGFGALVGFILPQVLLSSKWSARRREVNLTLPEALDLLRICMSAGDTFPNALKKTVDILPDGVTKEELRRVSAEIAAGRSLTQALSTFAHRVPTDLVESFVRAVGQAEQTEADMTTTLGNQADEARAEYERTIEVRTQKLQTTLFVPIMLLLLPSFGIFVFGHAVANIGFGL